MTTPPATPPSTPPSRYLLIVATYGVAIYQAVRGNWFEVAGLAGLGTGLVLLIAAAPAPGRPARSWLRSVALVCFLVTAAAVYYVYQRDYS